MSKDRKKNLRHFLKDGYWSALSQGLAESNFSAFAVFLGATPFQIGMMTSLPMLLASLVQFLSERIVQFFDSKKTCVLWIIRIQATLYGLMSVCAFFNEPAIPFLVLVVLHLSLVECLLPFWSSWVSEFVPARRRGLFFGKRNRINQLATFFAMILSGLFLDQIAVRFFGWPKHAVFGSLFLFGALFKVFALKHLRSQDESKLDFSVAGEKIKLSIIEHFKIDPAFRRMILFFGLMGFGVNISGPFNAMFTLTELKLDYLRFSFLFGVIAMARALSTPLWGKVLDKIGSLNLLIASTLLIPILPLGWCMTSNYSILVLYQVFAGLVWAAYELSAFTYLIESSPPQLRTHVFAAKQVTWSVASSVGTVLGGYILSSEFIDFYHNPRLVFWASICGRLLAALAILQLPEFISEAAEKRLEADIDPVEEKPLAA